MNLLTWLSRKRYPYDPLITVELSRNRLIHNLHEFRKLAPKNAVAPVLKSNAYGHGLFEVANILKNEHVPFFIVDSYFEAVALRAHGFKPKILIIGYTRPETMLTSRLKNVSFTITNLDTLKEITYHEPQEWSTVTGKIGTKRLINRFRPHTINVHLKIDTGMNRQGIIADEIDDAIRIIKADDRQSHDVMLEGICSHFSDAGNTDESFTESQIHIWNELVKKFKHSFHSLKYIHLASTDGHPFTSDIDANVSRLGIGLYGLTENNKLNTRLDLKPVLSMKTIVTGMKHVKKDNHVGYSKTFTAKGELLAATVPAGYFEGIDRRLSNKGVVVVGEHKVHCPIIGRVSMNITTIDVTKVPGVEVGTEVTLISNDASDPNSILSMAKNCDTITYEIAVHIERSVKRVVVE